MGQAWWAVDVAAIQPIIQAFGWRANLQNSVESGRFSPNSRKFRECTGAICANSEIMLRLLAMIPRVLQARITEQLQVGGKIVIIYGARQVGKTTLVRRVLDDLPYRSLAINADELRYTDVLSSRDLRRLRGLVRGV